MDTQDTWQPFLKEVVLVWNLVPESISFIHDLDSRVYFAKSFSDEHLIIRITPVTRRSEEELCAELDWLSFLSQQGARVFPKIVATNTQVPFLKMQHDGNEYWVCCFVRFAHRPPINNCSAIWNADLFTQVGEMTGYLHKLTSGYSHKAKHHHYDEDFDLGDLTSHEEYVDQTVLSAVNSLLTKLKKYPRQQGYGLLHGDIKQDNYFLSATDKTLFLVGFDDNCQCWLVYDFVVSLYHNYVNPLTKITKYSNDDVIAHMRALLYGYEKHLRFERMLLFLVPDLLALCEAKQYLKLKRLEKQGVVFAKSDRQREIFAKACKQMEQQIIKAMPHFGIDFTKI